MKIQLNVHLHAIFQGDKGLCAWGQSLDTMKVFVNYTSQVAFKSLGAGVEESEGTGAGDPKAERLFLTLWWDTPQADKSQAKP